jgi:hypothetical protein
MILIFLLFSSSYYLGGRLNTERRDLRSQKLLAQKKVLNSDLLGSGKEESESKAITIDGSLLRYKKASHSSMVSFDDAKVPEKFWTRRIVKTFSGDLELSDDAKEFFELDDEECLAISEILKSKIAQVNASDISSFESRVYENSVLVKVPASSLDPDQELKNLASQLENFFPSRNDARFFIEQSREEFAAKTGIFGSTPRFIRVAKIQNGQNYVATIHNGGDVGKMNFDEYEERLNSKTPIAGASSTMITFSKLPGFLEHIFEESAQANDLGN